MFGIGHSLMEERDKLPSFVFSRILEIAQQDFSRRDSTVDGAHVVQD